MTRSTEVFLKLVQNKKFEIDSDGNIRAQSNHYKGKIVGSPNKHSSVLYITSSFNSEAVQTTGGRLAWMIHYGFPAPNGLSVVYLDGNKRNFKRNNLALIPTGKEQLVKLN